MTLKDEELKQLWTRIQTLNRYYESDKENIYLKGVIDGLEEAKDILLHTIQQR